MGSGALAPVSENDNESSSGVDHDSDDDGDDEGDDVSVVVTDPSVPAAATTTPSRVAGAGGTSQSLRPSQSSSTLASWSGSRADARPSHGGDGDGGDGDGDGGDDGDGGGVSDSVSVGSSRRLVGSERDKEDQYNALRSQFKAAGKSVRGGRVAKKKPQATRKARKAAAPLVPRVATLEPKRVPVEVTSPPKRRLSGSSDPELFSRLYLVRARVCVGGRVWVCVCVWGGGG